MRKKKSPIEEIAAIDSEAHLYPVVQFWDGPLCPWHITEIYSSIRLSGNMIEEEVGSVFAQLVNYNDLPSGGEAKDVLDKIINSSRLILPGGIQVRETAAKVINPGCCCGLEGWREWLRFLQTGTSPWLGHSPMAYVEKVDSLVRVHSSEKAGAFHIDFEYSKFKAQLKKVQQDLIDFLLIIEIWAAGLGFPEPQKLSRKFDEYFTISHELSKYNLLRNGGMLNLGISLPAPKKLRRKRR